MEKLSNRLAARAQQIAQDKRERESAILDHVQALERKLDASQSRLQDMEKEQTNMREQLMEEKKARITMQNTYQEEITSLTHRLGRVQQSMETKLEEERGRTEMSLRENEERLGHAVEAVSSLSHGSDMLSQRCEEFEKYLPELREHAMEARRLVEIERKVKAETEGMLMKLLDETFTTFRTTLEEEKKTRERNEEAMLQILENMSDTSSGADL